MANAAIAVVGALAVMAALGFGRFGYTMLLPATRTGLSLSFTGAGLLGTANLAGYLMGSFGAGRLIRLRPHAAAALGLAVVAASLAWMAIARSSAEALGARWIAGLAAALVYVQALGLVARFPPARRGLVSGIMHAGNGAGLILTGLGLPPIVARGGAEGWRLGWVALGVSTLAVAPLAWLGFRGASQTSPLAPAPEPPGSGWATGSPTRTYAGLYGLFGLSYIIYVTFFAETLRSRGLPLNHTGLAWAAVGALSLVSGPGWGVTSDRWGRATALALVFGLQALSYAAFLVDTLPSLVFSVMVFGVTAWGVPAIMAAAMGDGGQEGAMRAFGWITTVMSLGPATGPLLAGAAADLTRAPDSGLWISIAGSVGASVWSLGATARFRRGRRRAQSASAR
jgi:MFS family permease